MWSNFEKIITDKINNNTFGIADIRCLLIINLNPGLIFNELIVELDISKQSLNRVLKKLIHNNFIIQKINSEDARKKNLYLSNQTNKMLDSILEPILKDIAEAFQKSILDPKFELFDPNIKIWTQILIIGNQN